MGDGAAWRGIGDQACTIDFLADDGYDCDEAALMFLRHLVMHNEIFNNTEAILPFY